MASTTVVVGVALIILGLTSYFLTGGVSKTALIPAAFGFAIALAGLIARDERKRKHAIHAAVLIALIGFMGSLQRLLKTGDIFHGDGLAAAAFSQTLMAVLTLSYVVLAAWSFIKARRSRA